MTTYRQTGARWVASVVLRDAVLVLALALALLGVLPPTIGAIFVVAIPLVLAAAIGTLHAPTSVELDDQGIVFSAYGRAHRFLWREVERVRVRRFLVRDRVLVRLFPSPPWRGRYWLTDALDGFDELVNALEARASR